MKEFLNELMVHDTYIYGYGINSKKHELYFDVDIVQEGTDNDKCLFKVRPATIVFKNVWDINIDISTDDDIIVSHIETTKCGAPKNKDYVNYEIEYEAEHDDEGKHDFIAFMKQHEIEYKESPKKSVRAFEAKK